MNSNKFLIGGIAGSITAFALFYVVYGLLLTSYFDKNYIVPADMEHFKWWANIVSNLAYGFLFAYLLGKANISSASSAVGFGFVAGLLIEASLDLGLYSASQGYKSVAPICVDSVVSGVVTAIVCAVVVMASGMGKKAA